MNVHIQKEYLRRDKSLIISKSRVASGNEAAMYIIGARCKLYLPNTDVKLEIAFVRKTLLYV